MSKEWNWKINKEDLWLKPSIESYYYVDLWKKEDFKEILDLGCGLGRHSILFAENGFNVTSCDLSEYGVNHLKEWALEKGLKIKTNICDMQNMPYKENSFDAIFAYHVISHTDSLGMRKILSEIERVLKKEGHVFLTLCSKETWTFKESGYPKIDENSVIKIDEGPEYGIPHFYVNFEDILILFKNYELLSIRHIDDIYYTDKYNHSKHYFLYMKLKKGH